MSISSSKLINLTKNTILAEKLIIADTFFARIKGLLGKKSLPVGHALIIKPCNSIHTFFMCFSIDVIFLDHQNRVIKTYSRLHPWRLSGIFPKAAYCIELPSGTLAATDTNENDKLIEMEPGTNPIGNQVPS